MSEFAVRVSEVDKAYRIWRSPASRLKAAAMEGAARLLPPLRPMMNRARGSLYHDFYALRGINLEVKRGEAVAIIGRNGSGKSTLLQVATGTLPPTAGTVEINGRIAALLELGSGFNPEYTGRENVLLNATVLGLTPAQAEERFAAIADFAEIGEFIEQPVKTYSTGMAVRLAFAVLTQIEPEILIIDEALAVGDFLFQQKCFDVIRRFRASGCSFLFVSHSMGSVLELCDRALLLNQGQVEFFGSADEAVRLYEASAVRGLFVHTDGTRMVRPVAPASARKLEDVVDSTPSEIPAVAGMEAAPVPDGELGSILTDRAELISVSLWESGGREIEVITSGTNVILRIHLKTHVALDDPHVGFKVRDKLGRIVFETSSYCMRKRIGALVPGQEVVADFAFGLPLVEGTYSVVVGFANGGYGEYFYRELVLYLQGAKTFEIVANRREDRWTGIVNLKPKLECRVTDAESHTPAAHG